MDACKMRLPIGSYRLDAFLHCSRCGLGTGGETLRGEDKDREENGGGDKLASAPQTQPAANEPTHRRVTYE